MKYNTLVLLACLMPLMGMAQLVDWIMPVSDEVRTVSPAYDGFDYVSVSDDDKYMVTSDGNSVVLWDLKRRLPIHQFLISNYGVRISQYAPHMVYVSAGRDYWELYDIFTGRRRGFFSQSEVPPAKTNFTKGAGLTLKISDSGKALAIVTDDGYVLDRLSTAKVVRHRSAISRNDSLYVVTGLRPEVWDLKNAQLLRTLPLDRQLDKNKRHKRLIIDDGVKEYVNPFHLDLMSASITDRGEIVVAHPEYSTFVFDHNGNYLNQIRFPREGRVKNMVGDGKRMFAVLYCEPSKLFTFTTDNPKPEEVELDLFLGSDMNANISSINKEGYFAFVNSSHLRMLDANNLDWVGKIFTQDLSYHDRGNVRGLPLATITDNSNKISTTNAYYSTIIYTDSIIDSKRNIKEGFNGTFTGNRNIDPSITYRIAASYVNDRNIFSSGLYGDITVYEIHKVDPIDHITVHGAPVLTIERFNDGKHFFTSDMSGLTHIWDASTLKIVMSFQSFNNSNDYIFYTPDHYYKGSKDMAKHLNFAKGLETYTFDQFDLKYNRPDIIIERLGGDPKRVEILRNAWRKRVKKMGFTEQQLTAADWHTPDLAITNQSKLYSADCHGKATLSVKASDSKYNLHALHVLLNGVPILGEKGMALPKAKTYANDIDVPLCNGENLITVYCTNAQGDESAHQQIALVNKAAPVKQELYIAAIGVSNYADSDFNLKYCAKDAADFSHMFSAENTDFENIHRLSLSDAEFDASAVERIRQFFAQAKRDDVTILYYAGHGLLDSDLNYYLGTYNTDFSNPKVGGVMYDDLAATLDGIKSIHKLCFIDACHSGEVDKDDYLAVNTLAVSEVGNLVFRSAGRSVHSGVNKDVADAYRDMFVDLRAGNGATVITSCEAEEVSVEGDLWQNGLFTWCVNKGLAGEADANTDQKVTLDELVDYLGHKVSAVSKGKQTPQIRVQNRNDRFTLTSRQ